MMIWIGYLKLLVKDNYLKGLANSTKDRTEKADIHEETTGQNKYIYLIKF